MLARGELRDMPLGAFLIMALLDEHHQGLTVREIALASDMRVHAMYSVLEELETRGMVRVVLDTQPPTLSTPRRTLRRYIATPIGVMLYREEKAVFEKITGKS